MSPHTDRRTVLKTTGGLLAGATLSAGPGAAQGAELQMDVMQEAINPESKGRIPVEVRITDPSDPECDPLNPEVDIYFGLAERFIFDGDIVLPENADKVLATPVRVADFDNPHEVASTYRMFFRTQDVDFSEVSVKNGLVDMGIAIVNGIYLPGIDAVRVMPGERINGPEDPALVE